MKQRSKTMTRSELIRKILNVAYQEYTLEQLQECCNDDLLLIYSLYVWGYN